MKNPFKRGHRRPAGAPTLHSQSPAEFADQQQGIIDDAVEAASTACPYPGELWGNNREDHIANELRTQSAAIKEAHRASHLRDLSEDHQELEDLGERADATEAIAMEARANADEATAARKGYEAIVHESGTTHTLSHEEQSWKYSLKDTILFGAELAGLAIAMYFLGGTTTESYILASGVVVVLLSCGFKLGHDSKRIRQAEQAVGTPLETLFNNTLPNPDRVRLEMKFAAVTAMCVAVAVALLRVMKLEGYSAGVKALMFVVFMILTLGLVVGEALIVSHHIDIFRQEHQRRIKHEQHEIDNRDDAEHRLSKLVASRNKVSKSIELAQQACERDCNAIDAMTESFIQLWRKTYLRNLAQPAAEAIWDDMMATPQQASLPTVQANPGLHSSSPSANARPSSRQAIFDRFTQTGGNGSEPPAPGVPTASAVSGDGDINAPDGDDINDGDIDSGDIDSGDDMDLQFSAITQGLTEDGAQ